MATRKRYGYFVQKTAFIVLFAVIVFLGFLQGRSFAVEPPSFVPAFSEIGRNAHLLLLAGAGWLLMRKTKKNKTIKSA